MPKKLFESATLQLTAWYLLVLMVVSVMFSTILYSVGTAELDRGLRTGGGPRELFLDTEVARQIRLERLEDGRNRLLGNLVVFNAATLTLGGVASYLLARRTLRPIQEAMDAQTQFVSDASHELRTPLAVMQSEIEVNLRDKKSTKASYGEILASNLDEVKRMQDLTDRLLVLSSEKSLPLSAVQLDDVSTEAINNVMTLAQTKDISIDDTVGRISVRANHGSLSDVVTILLDNAIKYSPKGSTIAMSSDTKGKSAYLHVADQGVGIDPVDIDKIFHRFYRADSSRSKAHVEGHGLGLSIAARIIEDHGGTIRVTSAIDQGTTFHIKLPLA